MKLAPEDVWDRLRLRAVDQDAGPAVHRPDQGAPVVAPRPATFVAGVAHDAFWLVAQPAHRDRRRRSRSWPSPMRPARAQDRQAGRAQEDHPGPGPARQAGRLRQRGPGAHRAVPGRGRLRRRQRQAGARPRLPGDPAAARQDPQHLGSRHRRGAGLARKSTTSAVAIGVRSGLGRHQRPALRQGRASWPTPTPTACTSPRCCARCSCRHFRPLVQAGNIFVAMPPLFRVDVGKQVFYALDEDETRRRARAHQGARSSRARSASRASRDWAR